MNTNGYAKEYLATVIAAHDYENIDFLMSMMADIGEHITDLKCQMKDSISSTYGEFNNVPRETRRMKTSLKRVMGKVEALDQKIKEKAVPNLKNSISEMTCLTKRIAEISLTSKIVHELVQLNNAYVNAQEFQRDKKYFDAVKAFETLNIDLENSSDHIKRLKVFDALITETGKSRIYLQDLMTKTLQECFQYQVLTGIDVSKISYYILKVDKNRKEDFDESFQALFYLQKLDTFFLEFAAWLKNNIMSPIILHCCTVTTENKDGQFMILKVEADFTLPKSEYTRVFANLMCALTFLKTYLGVKVKENYTIMNELGKFISDDFCITLINHCLADTIPSHSNQLEEYKVVISATEEFINNMQAIGFLSGTNSNLTDYTTNAEMLCATKTATLLLVRARDIILKDLYDVMEVEYAPEVLKSEITKEVQKEHVSLPIEEKIPEHKVSPEEIFGNKSMYEDLERMNQEFIDSVIQDRSLNIPKYVIDPAFLKGAESPINPKYNFPTPPTEVSEEGQSPLKDGSEKMGSPIKNDHEQIKSPIKCDPEQLQSQMKEDPEKIRSTINDDPKQIESSVKEDSNQIRSPVKKDLEHVTSPLKEDPEPITSPVKEDPEQKTSPVKKDIELITSPVKDDLQQKTSSVKKDVEQITSPVKENHEPITSPVQKDPEQIKSPVKEDPEQIKGPVMEDPEQIKSPVKEDLQQITSPVKEDPKQIASPVKEDPQQIKSPIKGDLEQITSPVKDDLDQIKSPVKDDLDQIKSPVKEDLQQITSPVNKNSENVTKIGNTDIEGSPQISSPIKDDLEQIRSSIKDDLEQIINVIVDDSERNQNLATQASLLVQSPIKEYANDERLNAALLVKEDTFSELLRDGPDVEVCTGNVDSLQKESPARKDLEHTANSLEGDAKDGRLKGNLNASKIVTKTTDISIEGEKINETLQDTNFSESNLSLEEGGSLTYSPLHSKNVTNSDTEEEAISEPIEELEANKKINNEIEIVTDPNLTKIKLSSAVFSLPKCQISKSAHELTALLNEVMDDCVGTSSKCARNLFITARKIVEMFCAIAPIYFREYLDTIPQQAALFHNDCYYIAHCLLTLGHSQRLLLPSGDRAIGSFGDQVIAVRTLGSSTLLAHMQTQRNQILDIIRNCGLSTLRECSTLTHDTERALRQCVRQLEKLKSVWEPVLPVNVYIKALACIMNSFLDELINRVVTVQDIPAETASQLVKMFNIVITRIKAIFPDPSIVKDFENWGMFQELVLVLGGNLRFIKERWGNGHGPLALHFTPEQLRQLIRALFQNTERRSALLAEIR